MCSNQNAEASYFSLVDGNFVMPVEATMRKDRRRFMPYYKNSALNPCILSHIIKYGARSVSLNNALRIYITPKLTHR